MKDSFSYFDLLLNSTDLIGFDDFYVLTCRSFETHLQGKYNARLILNISEVAERLVKYGHEVTNWDQRVDSTTGYVYVEFKLNRHQINITLT